MSGIIEKLLQTQIEQHDRFYHEWGKCTNDELAYRVFKSLATNACHALLDMASMKSTEFCPVRSNGALGAMNVLAMQHRERADGWQRIATFIGLLCLSQDMNVASSAIRQFQFKLSDAMDTGYSYLIQACNSTEVSFCIRYKGMSVRGLAFLVLIMSEYPIDSYYVCYDAIRDCSYGLNAWSCESTAYDSRFDEWSQHLHKTIERRKRTSPQSPSIYKDA